MSAANFVQTLPGNPILIRALERELREAEKQVEDVLSHGVRCLVSGIAGGLVGEGPHLDRVAEARRLLTDAENNYLMVAAELQKARTAPSSVLTFTRNDGGYKVTVSSSLKRSSRSPKPANSHKSGAK